MKFYSRLGNRMLCSQNFHIFQPFAHFLPTFKIKSGHDFRTKYNANTLIFLNKSAFLPKNPLLFLFTL